MKVDSFSNGGLCLADPTSESPPTRAVAGQLSDPGAEHEAEQQPARQPEGHGVMVIGGGAPAQEVERRDEDGQEARLQQQTVPEESQSGIINLSGP